MIPRLYHSARKNMDWAPGTCLQSGLFLPVMTWWYWVLFKDFMVFSIFTAGKSNVWRYQSKWSLGLLLVHKSKPAISQKRFPHSAYIVKIISQYRTETWNRRTITYIVKLTMKVVFLVGKKSWNQPLHFCTISQLLKPLLFSPPSCFLPKRLHDHQWVSLPAIVWGRATSGCWARRDHRSVVPLLSTPMRWK